MYECCICSQHARRTLAGILRHIRQVHPHFQGKVPCGIEGCPSTPCSYEALRKHMHRYHQDILTKECERELTQENPPNDEQSMDMDVDVNDSESSSQDDLHNYETPAEKQTAIVGAQFILKTRDGLRLTQVATDSIVADTKIIVQSTLQSVEQAVMNKVEALGIDLTDDHVHQIRAVFSNEKITNPFFGLDTQYLQEQFMREHFNYVAPNERVLGRSHQLRPNGTSHEVLDCCYDVPLLSSLQAFLSISSVRDQVFNSHKLCDGKSGDYCDGSDFDSHPLFKEDPCALQIRLYYDDLEVCNALGSKTKKHKLGLFYYSLGNIEPKFRSTVHSIQLLTVVKTSFIDTYGVNEILAPFVEAINKLESVSGEPFVVDGKVVHLRGTLTLCSADNPAACTMGGFKALHSAFRKCRNCMAIDSDMQSKFTENEFQLRTRDTHASHIVDIADPLHSHISTTYGITGDSILNQSRYFHVADGIAPDIMHDVLEGITQLTLKWLLRYCIQEEKFFTLSVLNDRITSFNYGIDSRNKPSEISNSTFTSSAETLKQSATQAWCLARYFPILMGDLVPEDNERWNNYLNLLTVMEYVFAPVINDDMISYLEMLIELFLSEFVRLYPARPLTPKMHYLVHVPTWMRRCGPLVHTWCMRYEAKNKYFKKMAETIGNFKNIAKTVAHRHQRSQCHKMTCCTDFFGGENSYGKSQTTVVSTLEYALEFLSACPDLSLEAEVHRVIFAEIDGTRYNKGSFIFWAIDEDIPVFGKIEEIIVTSHHCLFVLLPYVGSCFYKHFNVYEVAPTHGTIVCRQKDFVDYHPLSLSKSFDPNLSHKNFVSIKYHVQ